MIYQLFIRLDSPALIGSGQGLGAIIDQDVVFNDMGIPYLPARRIKGCLRDSAQEIKEMFVLCGIQDLLQNTIEFDLEKVFGNEQMPSQVYFSNLDIFNYEDDKMLDWLEYFTEEFSNIVSNQAVIDTFTEIRQQTSIENDPTKGNVGVAKEHFLKSIRVLKSGLEFATEIEIVNEQVKNTIALACHNLHQIGTKRNRGLGYICCSLKDKNNNKVVDDLLKMIEDLCYKESSCAD